jgi:hypothetical protein
MMVVEQNSLANTKAAYECSESSGNLIHMIKNQYPYLIT